MRAVGDSIVEGSGRILECVYILVEIGFVLMVGEVWEGLGCVQQREEVFHDNGKECLTCTMGICGVSSDFCFNKVKGGHKWT